MLGMNKRGSWSKLANAPMTVMFFWTAQCKFVSMMDSFHKAAVENMQIAKTLGTIISIRSKTSFKSNRFMGKQTMIQPLIRRLWAKWGQLRLLIRWARISCHGSVEVADQTLSYITRKKVQNVLNHSKIGYCLMKATYAKPPSNEILTTSLGMWGVNTAILVTTFIFFISNRLKSVGVQLTAWYFLFLKSVTNFYIILEISVFLLITLIFIDG